MTDETPDLIDYEQCKRLFTDCRIVEMTNDEYHGQSWKSLSKTRLSIFGHNAFEYFCRYISCEIEDVDTAALLFGRVLHAVVLEAQGAVTEDNYREDTLAIFRPHNVPSRDADLVDEDGGELWIETFPEHGVVRRSAIWGTIDAGQWHILPDPGTEVTTGFCAFADMHPDGLYVRAIPDDVLSDRGAKQGKAWTTFARQHPGDVMMKFRTTQNGAERGWCDLIMIRRRLRKHGDVNQSIFQGGQNEVSIIGKCAETGIEVRTRLDFIKPVDGGHLITDVKTALTSLEAAWARQADQNLLFMQAAWQIGMAAHVFDGQIDYRFAVIDKKAPYNPESFSVENEYLELGCSEYQKHVREFKKCSDGEQPWERDGFGKVRKLRVPEWRKNQEVARLERELVQWQTEIEE
ncbi:MAG: PD-(D/E)XK nuclease-like domain-containing protein [Planctomycetaceae bacterium]